MGAGGGQTQQRAIRRAAQRARGLVALLAVFAVAVGVVPAAAAPNAADPSDVVLVLDFSTSILHDKTTRDDFAASLEEIAGRVVATRDRLTTGDVTISTVAFATSARVYPSDCRGLEFRGNPAAVEQFATCLRTAAQQYRRGRQASLTQVVGADTNYVAALTLAAELLPQGAERPAIVFFTDGKHEDRRVPASQVLPAAERLFSQRTPFALLPVGMGLANKLREELRGNLSALRDFTRDMRPCPGGEEFTWDTVVFDSPVDAGHAVATALERVTCTFTVVDPTPTPQPPPVIAPGAVRGVHTVAGDGAIQVTWGEPQDPGTSPISGYQVRCRQSGNSDWTLVKSLAANEHGATFGGLQNGVAHECEVAATSAVGPGGWTAGSAPVTPSGLPGAPVAIGVTPEDSAVKVVVSPGENGGAPVTDYAYECTNDDGAAWAAVADDVSSEPSARLAGLTNGSEYRCRAYAQNANGIGPASAASDPFRPCSGLLDCNPLLRLLAIAIPALLALLLAWTFIAWFRNRTRRWIEAYVDETGPVVLGRGPRVGLSIVGGEVQPDRREAADVRIRYLGGNRFRVSSRDTTVPARAGERIEITDTDGQDHLLSLRAHGARPVARVVDHGDWETIPATSPGSLPGGPADDWD